MYIFYGFINWILYLELGPGLGNIWYRIDDTGSRNINIDSLLNIMKQPFVEPYFWYPEYCDINFITSTCIFSFYYKLGTILF